LRLAAEIALTGVKLAFFEATKSIRTWWIEMNKSLVSACLYAVKFVIVKWRQVSEWVAGKLAEFMYYFNLLTAGQADYLTPGERESAITGSLDAYYDDLQNRLEKLADDVGSAMQSSLDQALTDGEQRIEALRGELNALRTTAAAEAAALGERTGAPTPTAVRNAIEAGVGATTGTFSAAGAQVAFAAVGNEQWQRQTAENTERTARNLEKIIRRNFDPYEFFGFGPP
jgi:hypothetical protein